jgi:hypothetical protein
MVKKDETEGLNPLRTFAVTLEGGKQILIKPVSWKNLEDLELLQLEIVKAAYDAKFSLATLFRASNRQFWDNAIKLASLLPVVGQKELGFNPEEIDDIDELCRVFVSASTARQIETGSVIPDGDNVLAPSEVSRINALNFIQMLIQMESLSEA